MQTILNHVIKASAKEVVDFLSNPYHLKQWTIHRHLYLLEGKCYEASDIEGVTFFTKIEVIQTLENGIKRLRFLWTREGKTIKFFDFEVKEIDTVTTVINIQVPQIPPLEKLQRLERLLHIELILLEKVINGHELTIKKEDALFMEYYLQQLKN